MSESAGTKSDLPPTQENEVTSNSIEQWQLNELMAAAEKQAKTALVSTTPLIELLESITALRSHVQRSRFRFERKDAFLDQFPGGIGAAVYGCCLTDRDVQEEQLVLPLNPPSPQPPQPEGGE